MRRVASFLVCLGLVLFSLKSWADARVLRLQVWRVDEEGQKQPARGAQVTLARGNPTRVLTHGLARVRLPEAVEPGEAVEVAVSLEGHQLWAPAQGRVLVPRQPEVQVVELTLVPLGSKVVSSDEAIERLLLETAARAKEQVRPEGRASAGDIDLGRYLKQWAVKYGLGLEQVEEEVRRWAREAERGDDKHKRAVAAFAEHRFEEAARYAAAAAEERLRESREVRAEERRLVMEAVRDLRLVGDAYASNYEFQKALEVYAEAQRWVRKEEDPHEWAELESESGRMRVELGRRARGEEVREHLEEAVEAFERALEVRQREALPQEWAATQNHLGEAWLERGLRSEAEEGRRMLLQAEKAFRRALEVRTREAMPWEWASTRYGLGLSLRARAERLPGDEGMKELEEARESFQTALTVLTPRTAFHDWRRVQEALRQTRQLLTQRHAGH